MVRGRRWVSLNRIFSRIGVITISELWKQLHGVTILLDTMSFDKNNLDLYNCLYIVSTVIHVEVLKARFKDKIIDGAVCDGFFCISRPTTLVEVETV